MNNMYTLQSFHEEHTYFGPNPIMSGAVQKEREIEGEEGEEVKVGEKFEKKGKIIDIIESGYSLGDKIIKFPKVVVAQ